jgi:gluconokinase
MHDDLLSMGPLAVIVMGVSGSGKSTLGVSLATAIGCPFLEGDDFHAPESVEKMRAGIALTDADRWPWLDRLGHAIGAEVANNAIAVVACSALKRVYRTRLAAAARAPVGFVLMDASPDELLTRLTARAHHYMPASLLSSQLDTLERPQPDEPAIAIDATRPVSASCEQVVAWLLERFG